MSYEYTNTLNNSDLTRPEWSGTVAVSFLWVGCPIDFESGHCARWGELRMVGVDDDPAILDIAREAGWLPPRGLDIVVCDAFEFVETYQERFDYVAVDLFRGPRMPGRIFGKPFLRRVRRLLEPHGWLAVNLFRDRHQADRVNRIAVFFDVRNQIDVGGNVIVHARNRRRR